MSVRYGILGLLAQRPRHGYEVHMALTSLVGGRETWDIKAQQVYNTLLRLEEGGLIAEVGVGQEGGPEKRILAVTPAGWKELETWFLTSATGEHLHDEVFLKLMLSMALRGNLVSRVIQVQRIALFRELHRVTRLRQRSDRGQELAYILLLDKTVMHLEAELRWLDMVEARLDEIRGQPLPHPEAKRRGRPPRRRP